MRGGGRELLYTVRRTYKVKIFKFIFLKTGLQLFLPAKITKIHRHGRGRYDTPERRSLAAWLVAEDRALGRLYCVNRSRLLGDGEGLKLFPSIIRATLYTCIWKIVPKLIWVTVYIAPGAGVGQPLLDPRQQGGLVVQLCTPLLSLRLVAATATFGRNGLFPVLPINRQQQISIFEKWPGNQTTI